MGFKPLVGVHKKKKRRKLFLAVKKKQTLRVVAGLEGVAELRALDEPGVASVGWRRLAKGSKRRTILALLINSG